jgi:dTMP kinase
MPEKFSEKGLFITFEGPEGAGKTTQINLLKEYFESLGRTCVLTREPGGTDVGEQLREIVKHYQGEAKIADETELLLFAASRSQHVRQLIQPEVSRGKIVLCDRFADSTTAYQGYARKMDLDFVKKLNAYAIGECVPNMTILLDLTPEAGFKRTVTRVETLHKEDRIEAEGLDFHRRVRNAFLKIAELEPERVKIVNADDNPENIQTKIRELVSNAFGPF